MAWIADRRLWLTADGSRLVEEGDPEARSLFVSKGKPVSDADVKRYGLDKPKAKAIEGPPDDKAVHARQTKAKK